MCKFKSFLVVNDEREKGGFRLLSSPYADSHSKLMELNGFKSDGGMRITFARVEFYPDEPEHLGDPEKYKLHLDEERAPDWYTDELKERVTVKAREHIARMIVRDKRPLLYGGQWILAKGAEVGKADFCHIAAMLDGSTLSDMHGGTLSVMRGGTLSTMWGGTLSDMWGGTLSDMWGGTLSDMHGGTLSVMRGGTLSDMHGGTLSVMRGGTLSTMWGGTLSTMWGGTLSDMRGGTLSVMRGGTLSVMWGGTLSVMWGGTLSDMWGGTLSDMRGGTLSDMWGGTVKSKSADAVIQRGHTK